MPYDRRHIVIQWGGTLPGGEIWSNMLRGGSSSTGASATVPDHETLEAWLHGHIKDAVQAWHERPSTRIHSTCKLLYVKANVVDQQGHYVENTTLEHNYPGPVAGGSTATFHPCQITWCISLTTDFARGLAHRGRFYSPAPAVQLDASNGLVDQADAQALAVSAKQYLEDLADTPGVDALNPFRILVMSKGGVTGATNVVTGVQIGRVLDTQVRRRNALNENYVALNVDQGLD